MWKFKNYINYRCRCKILILWCFVFTEYRKNQCRSMSWWNHCKILIIQLQSIEFQINLVHRLCKIKNHLQLRWCLKIIFWTLHVSKYILLQHRILILCSIVLQHWIQNAIFCTSKSCTLLVQKLYSVKSWLLINYILLLFH